MQPYEFRLYQISRYLIPSFARVEMEKVSSYKLRYEDLQTKQREGSQLSFYQISRYLILPSFAFSIRPWAYKLYVLLLELTVFLDQNRLSQLFNFPSILDGYRPCPALYVAGRQDLTQKSGIFVCPEVQISWNPARDNSFAASVGLGYPEQITIHEFTTNRPCPMVWYSIRSKL